MSEQDSNSSLRSIVINHLDKKHQVDIDLTSTIEDLRAVIYSLTLVPPQNQKILGLVKGSILKDDAVLRDMDIKNGQKVIVMGKAEDAEPTPQVPPATSTSTSTSIQQVATPAAQAQVPATVIAQPQSHVLQPAQFIEFGVWMSECSRIYVGREAIAQPAFRDVLTGNTICYACSTTCFAGGIVPAPQQSPFYCRCCEIPDRCLFKERADSITNLATQSKDSMLKDLSIQLLQQQRQHMAASLSVSPQQQQQQQRVKDILGSNYRSIMNYEHVPLQQKAMALVPKTILFNRKGEPIEKGEDQIRELLSWFKATFFKWVDCPPCDHCNSPTSLVGTSQPSNEEQLYKAGRTELYKCPSQHNTRFPRFNDPGKLLETRRGRCGEWANTFTLFCRALGYRSRYILDLTDHVWTEVWSDKDKRWIHCDSCEPVYDRPLTYESGWGKKLTYVFAFEVDGVFDVTRRYTTKMNELMTRRTMVDESWLQQFIQELNQKMRAPFTQERRSHLELREQAELMELAQSQNRSTAGSDLMPRQSGSTEWRSERGEMGQGLTGLSMSAPGRPLHVQTTVEKGAPPAVGTLIYKFEQGQVVQSRLRLLGSCKALTDRIELTPKMNDQLGAFWLREKQNIANGFVCRIRFVIGTSGADGMAFVVQNHSEDIMGKSGCGLGYDGIENSLAVEFDTYSSVDQCNDPNGNHISIHCNGEKKNSSHHRYSLAHCTPVGNISMSDGKVHHVVIVYNGTAKTMSVWYDTYFVLTNVSVDLTQLLDLPGGQAWIGMTAATGGLCQSHHILGFEFGSLDQMNE
ncbi:hypothetical protein SAMD00019534_089800 [Acytostelium subglobosum LB1]|uniref:hypothetical protein n=1 Tax=Acytostelium subglobosum LB1 TaxID=1410327 RepID=UPI00064500B0|nr:hypothetical protein SAMD00019534_089800 [Acytostelium subglobosum LB1]GAM25805.1 hypothetical protein SAMD00019534_089800 [Acytostelium subglobosum LB1]|eukprot:XP_012751323.1 hypothetical protein SAMD00019534_089800 [Acytostelium subglobosum LB1]